MRDWLEDKVREHRNRAPQTNTPLLEFVVSFRDVRNAKLGEQVLAETAVAQHRYEQTVVALVRRPEQAATHIDAAKRVAQPLFEARLEVTDAELKTPGWTGAGATQKTWHSKALRSGIRPSKSQSRAIRSSSAKLLPSGPQRVAGHDDLRWTDLPEVLLWPWPTWLITIAYPALFLSAAVGLAGTHGWFNLGIAASLVAVVIAAIWSTRPSKGWSRAVRVLGWLSAAALAYIVSVWVARTAQGSVQWVPFLLGASIIAVYATVATLIWGRLRRSSIAASTLLAIGGGLVALVGASAWIQQLLVRGFQDGLGYSQTPLPVRTLDLVANSGRASLLAGSGVVIVLFGLLALRSLGRSSQPGSTLQVVVAAPAIVMISATLFAPLFLRAWQVGDEIRSGDLRHADGIAACVQLGESADQALPKSWSQPGILVGPITGPALFIDNSATVPSKTALPGGLTAQVVPNSKCPPAKG